MNNATDSEKLIIELNRALALEMRAEVMYAHYAAYFRDS